MQSMKTNVKKHLRKGKNGVSVVRQHARGRYFPGKYGAKPKNDKYAARDDFNTDMETLKKHEAKYAAEFRKLMNGEWTSTARHKAFIGRRLKNVRRIINSKIKKSDA